MYDVNKVIEIALNEVGYLEKRNGDNLYSKTTNAGKANYTKYGYEMHKIYPTTMDYPAPWCDCFVDWCFYKAYGEGNAKFLLGGNFDDYTVASANLYKNKGRWYTSNPQVGDQVFFKNSTRICHTGLVYKVDDSYIYTVEGNTSGGSSVIANGGTVCRKKYSKTYNRIAGYGRPNYEDSGSTPSPSPSPDPSAAPMKILTTADVQVWLNSNYSFGLSIDNLYGIATQKALVKVIQSELNVAVDGIYGKNTKAAWKLVKVGTKGTLAKVCQAALICLGYDCGKYGADGDFGSSSKNAAVNFQKDNELSTDGMIGRDTSYAMFTKKSSKPTSTPAPNPSKRYVTTTADVQHWLNNDYNAELTVDGLYGKNTQKAIVRVIQSATGTAADGIFGKNSKKSWNNLKSGSAGIIVKAYQSALICRGYDCGKYGADGDFGGGTVSATKQYQSGHGLSADGIAGKNTAYSLFNK